MTQQSERVTIGMPADLTAALRKRLRELDGPVTEEIPLGALLRYVAARFIGIPQDQAMRYGRALPRGHTHDRNFPHAADLLGR